MASTAEITENIGMALETIEKFDNLAEDIGEAIASVVQSEDVTENAGQEPSEKGFLVANIKSIIYAVVMVILVGNCIYDILVGKKNCV